MSKDFAWGRVRFVRCPGCGTWAQSPLITVESLAAWYDSSDYQSAGSHGDGAYLDYQADETQRRHEGKSRYLRDLAGLIAPGSQVLEVGCATGSVLSALADEGHSVVGIDLAAGFVEQAKKLYGIKALVMDFLDYSPEDGPFDLIMMLGTISNLQDPLGHLRHAADLLKPDGWLYFNMPCADSLVARIYGNRYWMFAPSVTAFYSRAGIGELLKRAGFRMVKTMVDRQRPTVSKLLGHARLRTLHPLALKLGLAGLAPPFSLPIPGVVVVWAKPDHG